MAAIKHSNPVNHAEASQSTSPWSPLKIRIFRNLWIATLVSNIGTWMNEVGAGWVMTTLTTSPVMVAMVQTAITLPIFLLAIPAGALADIFDRRRYLIVTMLWMMTAAAVLGLFTILGMTNEWSLITLTFALGIGTAMMLPAMAAIVPELVPREELHRAIALNIMGINVSRTIGPALAGVIIAVAGSGIVFIINAFTFLFVILVLWHWQRNIQKSNLPAEPFVVAIRTGARFVLHSPALQATIIRSVGFLVFASALWALLPLIAKELLGGGPQTFGILMASMGIGGVLGALILPRIRSRISSDQLIVTGTILYAVAMFTIGYLQQLLLASIALAICGAAWMSVISSLQVAAQMSLPNWVRSRGLSVMMALQMGSLAGGSFIWGNVAKQFGITIALISAAIGAVIAVVITWRWHTSDIEKIDLTSSMDSNIPLTHDQIAHDRAPVMVIVHYHVAAANKSEFIFLINELSRSRKSNGALAWGVLEDVKEPGHYIEHFNTKSWLEHLRQQERVTNAEKIIQDKIERLLKDNQPAEITHFVGPVSDI